MNKEKDDEKTNQLTPNRLDEIVVPASIWHRKYKDCMIATAGLTEEEAQAALDASMGEYDYSADPEESALMEMSYWTD